MTNSRFYLKVNSNPPPGFRTPSFQADPLPLPCPPAETSRLLLRKPTKQLSLLLPRGIPRGASLPYHHLRRFGIVTKWRRGQLCQKKVKPTDGDAATAVRYFILFLSGALRIILHKNGRIHCDLQNNHSWKGKTRCVFFVLSSFSCISLTAIDLRFRQQVWCTLRKYVWTEVCPQPGKPAD